MHRCGNLLALTLTLALAASAQGQSFAELSRFVPRDANALIVVNARGLYESSLGRRENWRESYLNAAQSTTLLMPPSADQMILGAAIDIDTMRPDWEAAIMRLSIDPTIAEIAEARGGVVDRIGGLDAVWLGGRTCLVKFGPNVFGLLTPATRQEASRWVAEVTSQQSLPLSPYLHQALTTVDDAKTQIVVVADLVDALPESLIRTAVEHSDVLAAAPGIQAASLLTGLQGVRFGVRVGEQMESTLHIDFLGETSPLAPVAKPLLLGILEESGAMLPEFNDWQAVAQDHSLTLAGQLSREGLGRVLSLLAVDVSAVGQPAVPLPPSPQEQAEATPDDEPAAPRRDPTVVASQRYFRAVGNYVADAQRLNRADSLRQSVLWLQNYARRIENLSTRNVDPELVQYGQHVAQTFRGVIDLAYGIEDKQDAVQSLSGPTEVRTGLLPTARTVTVPGARFREFAPYYSAVYNPMQQRQAAQEQQRLNDEIYAQVEQARQTLTQLVADHETVRSQLSQRYGVQFR